MSASKKIEIKPIGFVKRASSDENVRDKSLVSRIVLKKVLVKALDGIEEFSHVFIIYWMHKISKEERVLSVTLVKVFVSLTNAFQKEQHLSNSGD